MSGMERDLAELRAVAARAREQADEVAERAEAVAAGLRAERESLERELRREQWEQPSLEERLRQGQVPPEHRALAERIVRGETTLDDVLHGRDLHPTAQAYRQEAAVRARETLDELLASDPEFAEQYETAQAEEARVIAEATPPFGTEGRDR